MELLVQHELHYSYSAPVYPEPQTIYMVPRQNHYHRIRDFHLAIFPKPSLVSKNLDLEGNSQYIAHFPELTQKLEVKSSFKITIEPANPFDFLIYPFELGTMPFEYSDSIKKMLKPYLKTKSNGDDVKEYGLQLQQKTNNIVLDFLGELVKKISGDFVYEYREKGKPMSPGMLLKKRKGTCRDYANLCIEVCRKAGIAARFVSGYFHGDPEQDRNLHGWVEVFLLGAGWRGIDPTQGVWVDEKYIPLAASADPVKVAPVDGNFRGTAKAKMEVKVSIVQAIF